MAGFAGERDAAMNAGAWLGLGLGAVLGLGYGLWQRRTMGDGPRPGTVGGAAVGAVVRLAALLVAIWLVLQYTVASRLWLVGGVMVSYGLVLVATVLQATRKKK